MIEKRGVGVILILFSVLLSISFVSAVDDGLVAYYKFDEGSGTIASDSVGDNDGVIYGATWVDSFSGSALDISGVSKYVELSEIVGSPVNDVTYSIWFKNEHMQTYNAPLMSFIQGEDITRFLILREGHSSAGKLYVASHDSNIISTSKMDDNQWHHVAVVFKPGVRTMELYTDGVLQRSVISDGDFTASTTPIKFGSAGRDYFPGMIDEVKIYDRALSEDEIRVINEPEILSSRISLYPSLVVLNQGININYNIDVTENSAFLLPETYYADVLDSDNVLIDTIVLTQSYEPSCYDRYYEPNICYVRYSNEGFIFDETGMFSIFLNDVSSKVLVVDEGYFEEKLILDNQYGEYEYDGDYDSYMEAIQLEILYEKDDNSYPVLLLEFVDEESSQMFLDGIFEEILSERIKIRVEEIKRNKIYILQMGEGYYNFLFAIWRSENKILYTANFREEQVEQEDTQINAEQFVQALIGGGNRYNIENPSVDDFDENHLLLTKAYLTKYFSSLKGDELDCIPQWECSLNPLICPQHGRQTETCQDINECAESYTRTIQCIPGICMGCLEEDGTCIPYGHRFRGGRYVTRSVPAEPGVGGGGGGAGAGSAEEEAEEGVEIPIILEDASYYCSVDGRIRSQRSGDSICDNNYECKSNDCSNGKCVDVIGEIREQAGFFRKLGCRILNIVSLGAYDYLGCVEGDLSILEVNIINPEEGSTIIGNSVLLEVTTNEEAVCEYSKGHHINMFPVPCEEGEACGGGAGGGGVSSPIEMSETGDTEHSQLITSLDQTTNDETQEEWYRINVKCEDEFGDSNSDSVIFFVDLDEEDCIPIWSEPQEIIDDANPSGIQSGTLAVSLAIDSNDDWYMTYYDTHTIKNINGESDLITDVVHGADLHDMAIDKNGNLHVVYFIDGHSIMYTNNIGGSWSEPQEIVNEVNFQSSSSASIVTDSNDDWHIVYRGFPERDKSFIKYLNSVSDPVTLAIGDVRGHSIAIDSNDKLHITYFTGIHSVIYRKMNDCFQLEEDWFYNPETENYYYLTAPMTWSEANAEAEMMGGYLTAIESGEEEQWLDLVFNGAEARRHAEMWIGFNDIDEEGVWVWTNGEPVVYTYWSSGQPDNGRGSGQDVGVMNYYRENGGWWDDRAITDVFPGIIEREIPVAKAITIPFDPSSKSLKSLSEPPKGNESLS